MNENERTEKLRKAIQIAERGLWRFFDDGMVRWSQESLTSLFSNEHLDQPEIQRQLQALENQGLIKIHRAQSCYLEVLKTPQ
jgi:hypothetical protein